MLRTDKLSFTIKEKELLRQISIEIPKGSFVGLIGPNGSGKSTLLKTIYRANKATAGAVYIDGQDMDYISNREMSKKMAVVTQENEISFDFSVMEMMMIGRYAHRGLFSSESKKDHELCLEALQLVGMEEFEERSFLSLSGGEKQRVLIASAFSRKTEFIVLDEPINHLDIGYQFQIMDILKRQKDTTVFMAIHDMNMALRYCDYVIALNRGEVVAKGSAKEVLNQELLKELFRVKAKVMIDNDGEMYIRYLGS